MNRRRSESGNAAVEFALLAPLLGIVLVGLGDLGIAVNIATKLDSAARAGAVYAMYYPNDTNGVKLAAQGATNDGSLSLKSGTPALFCTCGSSAYTGGVGSAGANPQVDCTTGTCTSPKVKNFYVTVGVTQTFTPTLTYAGFFGSLALTGTATVQVQ